MTVYFSGQGTIYLARRVGSNSPYYEVGNCPRFEISMGGAALADAFGGTEEQPLATPAGERPALMMQLEDFSPETLEMLFYGDRSKADSAARTEIFVSRKGATFPLSAINITGWTSLKYDGTTYQQGTDYKVNPKFGSVYIPETSLIPDGTSVTASYTSGEFKTVTAFSKATAQYSVRFEGVNTADNMSPVVVDVHKVHLYPPDRVQLIADGINSMQIVGTIIYDEDKSADTNSGGYFRIRTI